MIAVALRCRNHTNEGDETEQQAREFKDATNRRDVGLVDATLGYRRGLTIVDRLRMMSGCRVVRCVHVRRRSIVVRRGRLELAKSPSSSLSWVELYLALVDVCVNASREADRENAQRRSCSIYATRRRRINLSLTGICSER